METGADELRMIVMLAAQTAIPAAGEVVKTLARALSLAAETAAPAIGAARDRVLARVDGLGSTGIVSERALRGEKLDLAVVDEGLARSDIRELGEVCRSVGIGFSVCDAPGGRTALVFRAADAKVMQHAVEQLFDAYAIPLSEREELSQESPAPARGARQQPFEREGLRWSPVEASEGEAMTWRAALKGGGDRPMAAYAAADGSWSIRFEDTSEVVRSATGEALSGRAAAAVADGGLFEATRSAASYARNATDPALRRADASAVARRGPSAAKAPVPTAREVMERAREASRRQGKARQGKARARQKSKKVGR